MWAVNATKAFHSAIHNFINYSEHKRLSSKFTGIPFENLNFRMMD